MSLITVLGSVAWSHHGFDCGTFLRAEVPGREALGLSAGSAVGILERSRPPAASVALYEPSGSCTTLTGVTGRAPVELSTRPAAAPGTTTAKATAAIKLRRARRSLIVPPPRYGYAAKITDGPFIDFRLFRCYERHLRVGPTRSTLLENTSQQ